MWKLIVGFIVFAGLAMFVLMRAGGDIDMSGEKHGTETTHAPEHAPVASAAALVAPAASAVVGTASAVVAVASAATAASAAVTSAASAAK